MVWAPYEQNIGLGFEARHARVMEEFRRALAPPVKPDFNTWLERIQKVVEEARMPLKMKQREKLPSKDFALPGKGEGKAGKGSGSYPIDTKARARNALSRGAQNASPAAQAEIKKKVSAKYPSIDQKGGKR